MATSLHEHPNPYLLSTGLVQVMVEIPSNVYRWLFFFIFSQDKLII